MKIKFLFLAILVFVILLGGVLVVGGQGEYKLFLNNTRTSVTESDNTFSLRGQLVNVMNGYPLAGMVVRLAEVYRHPGGDVFILDDAFSPGDKTDNGGYFEFNNILQFQLDKNPAEYVIVIEGSEFDIIEQGNHPINTGVWVIYLGTSLDIGTVATWLTNNIRDPHPAGLEESLDVIGTR